MSTINSKFREISGIRFEPIPAKPQDYVRGTRVDKTVVLVDAKGTVFTNAVQRRCSYTDFDSWSLFAALRKLKVITAKVEREHRAYVEECKKASWRRHAANRITENAEVLGIKLTKAQLIKVAANR